MKRVASNVVHDYLRGVFSQKHGGGKEPVPLDAVMNDRIGSSKAARQLQRHIFLREIARYFTRAEFGRAHVVFRLYYEQGFTAGEISALGHLGLTTKGVESMIFRLTRDLKARFARIP